MVEAIGSLAKLIGRTVQAAAPAAAPTAIQAAPAGADEARVAATQVARELAAAPPVDHDRVTRIKQAIADGKYPIAPEAVADRLLALNLDWRPGDRG